MTQSNRAKEKKSPTYIPSSSFTTDFGLAEEWYHGNLPHRNRNNLIQFITFRLDDSLPQVAQNDIKQELAQHIDLLEVLSLSSKGLKAPSWDV